MFVFWCVEKMSVLSLEYVREAYAGYPGLYCINERI